MAYAAAGLCAGISFGSTLRTISINLVIVFTVLIGALALWLFFVAYRGDGED